mgnify:FL=1
MNTDDFTYLKKINKAGHYTPGTIKALKIFTVRYDFIAQRET